MASPNWIKTAGLLQIGDSFERTEVVAGWTEYFYSPDGITGDCEIIFNAQSVDTSYMMGIDVVSGAPTGSSDIDWSMNMASNGTLAVFNNGAFLATSANLEQGTEIDIGEWFRLVYDSTAGKIYFYRGYNLFHTQNSVGNNLTFYPKGQFQNQGAKLWYAQHNAITALDAPTYPRYDLGAYEFKFTKNPLVAIGGHEFTLDSGATWNPCTSETIAVGSAYREPNSVKVRVIGSTEELICLSAYPNPTPPPVGATDTKIFFLGGQSQVLIDTDSLDPVIPAGKANIYQDLDLVDYNDKISKSEITTQFLKDVYEKDSTQPHITIGRYAEGGTGILNNLTTFVDNDKDNPKIRDWSEVGEIAETFIINYNNLLMKIENEGVYNVTEKNVIWLLGEQDANLLDPQYSVYDAVYYEGKYDILLNRFSTGFGLDNLYISAVGRDVDGLSDGGREIVEATQLSLGANNPLAEVFTNIAKTFVSTGQMEDNIHYNDSGRQDLGTALFEHLPSVPFAPIITEENNDTNLISWTNTGTSEVQIQGGGWNDQASPLNVGVSDYAIGDIEIRVKAEGVNPASSIVANTIAFTAADEIGKSTIVMFANDLDGLDADTVTVKLITPMVQYKTRAYVKSETLTYTPSIADGKVTMQLPDTDNMVGAQYYLFDFGGGVRYRAQIPVSATDLSFWSLPNLKAI